MTVNLLNDLPEDSSRALTGLSASRRLFIARLGRLALAAPATVALAACGFELRRAPELHFSTLVLQGFRPESNVAAVIRQQIATTTTTRVVESATQAQVILQAYTDNNERIVEASTAAGQVRELTLRTRFVYRVRTVDEVELIPRTQLLLMRDLTYSEEAALGKEQEEAVLYRAMQQDIVGQLMRRLATVRLPA
jgi:LPS-assembly lipoprotein